MLPSKNKCYEINLFSSIDLPEGGSVTKTVFDEETVTNAFILKMKNSKRDFDKKLLKLCKNTYIQLNEGFKNCYKKYVDRSSKDIVFSYYNLFISLENNNFAKRQNILVLEEDAEILDDLIFDKEIKNSINDFIKNNEFSIYSFGSIGLFETSFNYHKKFLNVLGYCQACIWSYEARIQYIDIIEKFIYKDEYIPHLHVDGNIISKFKNKYSFYKPLIIQKFPKTENMENWCYICNDSKFEKITIKMYIYFIHNILKLDKSSKGWYFLYKINNNLSFLLILVLILIILNYFRINKYVNWNILFSSNSES